MRTVDDARRECVKQLRDLARECERQSWQQRFDALQAKRDAYLYAAEIVQTCFAGLDLNAEMPVVAPGEDRHDDGR